MVMSGRQFVIQKLCTLKGNAEASASTINGDPVVSFKKPQFIELMNKLAAALLSEEAPK